MFLLHKNYKFTKSIDTFFSTLLTRVLILFITYPPKQQKNINTQTAISYHLTDILGNRQV